MSKIARTPFLLLLLCGGCGEAPADGEREPTRVALALRSVPAASQSRGAAEPVCGAAEASCDARCVDYSTDPSHCGSCGFRCDSGETCVGGRCGRTSVSLGRQAGRRRSSACGAGKTACAVGCVDLQRSARACGACEHPCEPGARCLSGTCISAARWREAIALNGGGR